MKLSELKRFARFLEMLFVFFRENGISSCLDPVDDPGLLLDRLLAGEVMIKSCPYGTGLFNVSLRFGDSAGDSVHYFLFGTGNGAAENQLMIDLWGREGFIMVETGGVKLPPFAGEFLAGSSGRCGAHVDMMSEEELMDYLAANRVRGGLVRIEVE